jgi:predicted RNA binding protein YcfA (HicA-like mRNA interferase family)
MARRDKLFAAMKANPRADWTISDVETVCRTHGIACKAPSRGSHYVLSHPAIDGRLTIPARRPIKRIYIQLLVDMIDSLEQE